MMDLLISSFYKLWDLYISFTLGGIITKIILFLIYVSIVRNQKRIRRFKNNKTMGRDEELKIMNKLSSLLLISKIKIVLGIIFVIYLIIGCSNAGDMGIAFMILSGFLIIMWILPLFLIADGIDTICFVKYIKMKQCNLQDSVEKVNN